MNKTGILFSIVIPCYNRGSMISVAINSVLAQDYSKWELLIIDDGSTDNTFEIISGFKDDRIRYLKTENRERGAARNTGVLLSKGDYIAFLDSDDYILPHHLSLAAEIINANSEIEFIHINFEFRDTNGVLILKAEKNPPLLNKVLITKNVIGCAGVIMIKKLALDYPFSENRNLSGTEDYELWLRIAAGHTINHFSKVSTVMIEHPERSMANLHVKKTEMRILLFLDMLASNEMVRNFIGNKWDYFCSCRYSYISLHASMAGDSALALKYWWKSLVKHPMFLLNRRSFSILKNILLSHS